MTKILQIKITLDDISPKIWRRFLVHDTISFQKLHETIQTVMGWEDYHLFEFRIGDVCITEDEEGHNLAESSFKKLCGSPEFIQLLKKTKMKNGYCTLDNDEINRILKAQEKNKPVQKYSLKSKINALVNLKKQKFTYVYDFGDSWEHTLVVEKILDSADAPFIPFCLAGERACPPEDCGSVQGYDDLVWIQKNKKHPRYKELIVDWLGEDFDFEKFALDDINKELHKLVKVDGRARYWVMKA